MAETKFGFISVEGGAAISPFEGDKIKASAHGIVPDNDILANRMGLPSIMNPNAIITLKGSHSNGLIDNSETDKERPLRWFEANYGGDSRDPSVANLINFGDLDEFARRPYTYQDFAFNKWFDVISNSRLITLRRYAAATTDDLAFPNMEEYTQPFPPVASAMTYFGAETGNDLSAIFNITSEMPWSVLKSEVHEVSPPTDKGADSLPLKWVDPQNGCQWHPVMQTPELLLKEIHHSRILIHLGHMQTK